MNSEAMIPSTMAQKKDAMTPMLMNMIAARSLRTRVQNGVMSTFLLLVPKLSSVSFIGRRRKLKDLLFQQGPFSV